MCRSVTTSVVWCVVKDIRNLQKNNFCIFPISVRFSGVVLVNIWLFIFNLCNLCSIVCEAELCIVAAETSGVRRNVQSLSIVRSLALLNAWWLYSVRTTVANGMQYRMFSLFLCYNSFVSMDFFYHLYLSASSTLISCCICMYKEK